MKEYDWGTDLIGADFVVNEIADERQAEVRQRRMEMLEQLSDADEQIMEKFLEGTEIPAEDVTRAIRKATIAGKIVPGPLRGLVPEQGRPSAPRRDRRLPARPRRISPRSSGIIPGRTRSKRGRPPTTSRSPRSSSSSRTIRSWATSPFSGSIRERPRSARSFTIRSRTRRSASPGSSRCTPINGKKSRKSSPATSWPWGR